jgi:hypothetical protein
MGKFLGSVAALGITLVQVNMRPGEVDSFNRMTRIAGIDTSNTAIVTRWVRR